MTKKEWPNGTDSLETFVPAVEPYSSPSITELLAQYIAAGGRVMDQFVSKEVQDIFQDLNQQADALAQRFHDFLKGWIVQLEGDGGGGGGQSNTPMCITPNNKVQPKRSVPQSSSVNKIILHRSKRAAANSQKVDKTDVQDPVSTPSDIEDIKDIKNAIVGIQSELHLMSELSSDQSKSAVSGNNHSSQKKKKKPFIAQQESVAPPGSTLASESSNASSYMITPVQTRYQTRSRTQLTAASKAPAVQVANSASKRTPIKLASLNHNNHKTTPAKCTRAGSPISFNQSATTRQQAMEKARQEKLMLSAEKCKKAGENKRAMLENKAQLLKEEREKRLQKIKENQLRLEQEKKEKNKWLNPASVAQLTAQQKRNEERRARLAELQVRKEEERKVKTEGRKKVDVVPTPTATIGSATKSLTKSKKVKPGGNGSKVVNKAPPPPSPKPIDVLLSPIQSNSKAGLNQRLDVTFSTPVAEPTADDDDIGLVVDPPPPPPPSPVSSTLMSEQSSQSSNNKDVAVVVMPSPGPSSLKVATTPVNNTTFNMAKKLMTPTTISTSYPMTPPPPNYETDYDISKYIDSEDDEEQAKARQARHEKPIPAWAQSGQLIKLIRAQFEKASDELSARIERVFPPVVLPVPVEDMGLVVRSRYVTRSSSVNWNKAKEIGQIMKK